MLERAFGDSPLNNQKYMDNQTQEKKYVCKSCGSESSGTPGTCCGAEREEKKDG